jgi:general secretion pathway protein M
MARLAALRGRIMALALLAILLAMVQLIVVQPVVTAYREADAEIERSQELLAGFRRLGAGRIQLQKHVEDLRERTVGQTAYLDAASEALAAADLQKLVTKLVESSGGRLLSTVTLPAREAAPFRQIAIQVRMDVDIAQAQKIFHGLDSADLLVFIENLHMRGAPVRNMRQDEEAAIKLDVRFDLYGYMRAEVS